jgi:hypothetical protein
LSGAIGEEIAKFFPPATRLLAKQFLGVASAVLCRRDTALFCATSTALPADNLIGTAKPPNTYVKVDSPVNGLLKIAAVSIQINRTIYQSSILYF